MILKGKKKLMLELGIDPKGEFLFMNDKSPYIEKVKENLTLKQKEYNELIEEAKDKQEYPTYTKKRAILFRRIYYVEDDIKDLENFLRRYREELYWEKKIGRKVDYSKEIFQHAPNYFDALDLDSIK